MEISTGPDEGRAAFDGCVPAFDSLALRAIPVPDFADVHLVPLPDGASRDPHVWARTVFGVEGVPRWVGLLFALRERLVGLIGVGRAPEDAFAVLGHAGQEVLLGTDDGHLDFRAGVAVDETTRTVRVTTVVRLKGLRGRVYFAPVSVLHGPVVRAMMLRAARVLARDGHQPEPA